MHLDFEWSLYSPNLPEAIILFTVAGETFIKRTNGKETILLELSLSNIRSTKEEVFRLKEEEEIVEVAEEVMI